MSNVIALDKLIITRVKTNWYIGRVHGAVFFSRSRSEVFLKHRRWTTSQKQLHNVVAMADLREARA